MKFNAAIFFLFVSSFSYAGEQQEWGKMDRETGTPVSFYELLTGGEKYNGWRVFTHALLSYDGEHTLLYPSCERYLIKDTSSTLAVDIAELEALGMSAEKLRRSRKNSVRYVSIEGVYSYLGRQKKSETIFTASPFYAGILNGISYLATDSSGVECSAFVFRSRKPALPSSVPKAHR